MATGAGHVEEESGKDSAPAPPSSSFALHDSIATAAGEAELDMVDVRLSTVDALAGREEAPAPAPAVETEEPLRGEHIMPDAVETLTRVLEGPTQADQIWGNRIGAYVLECKVRVGGWVEWGWVGSGRIELERRWRWHDSFDGLTNTNHTLPMSGEQEAVAAGAGAGPLVRAGRGRRGQGAAGRPAPRLFGLGGRQGRGE